MSVFILLHLFFMQMTRAQDTLWSPFPFPDMSASQSIHFCEGERDGNLEVFRVQMEDTFMNTSFRHFAYLVPSGQWKNREWFVQNQTLALLKNTNLIKQFYKLQVGFVDDGDFHYGYQKQKSLYLRRDGNKIFMYSPSTLIFTDTLSEQLLFDFDAPFQSSWLISGFPSYSFSWVSFKNKYFIPQLTDSLYHYNLVDYSEPYNGDQIIDLYISPKYGFVGFRAYLAFKRGGTYCETWFPPYYGMPDAVLEVEKK